MTDLRIQLNALPIWTPVGALVLAAAWLLPNAAPPWLAFHKDAWLATVLLGVAFVWLIRPMERQSLRLDPFSLLLLTMALLSLLQWQAGVIHFAGHAAMAFGYLGAAALAIVIGRAWSKESRDQFGDFMFLSLLLAAVTTGLFIEAQWFQLDWMGIWIQEVVLGTAPYGNLNQPNNAATLLILGIVSTTWFFARGKLRPFVWIIATAFFSSHIALTGSRIGYLSLLLLASIAVVQNWFGRKLPITIRMVAPVMLVFAATVWAANTNWQLGPAEASSQVVANVKVFERDLTSARLGVWKAYLAASLTAPWTGFGFEQGLQTQVAAGELGYRLNGLYTWSHNALIDVATWFGLPMAVAVLALIIWVMVLLARHPLDSLQWVFVAAIFPVVLHGLVELPLAFAYFLLPVCLLTGAVLSTLPMPSWAIPRAVVMGWTLSLGVLLGAIVYDYFRIENAFYTWRFELANIGKNHPMDIPDTLVLDQFEALLVGLRGSADTLSEQQVNDFEKAILHDPSLTGIQHLAEIRARQGDIVGAQRAADLGMLTAKPHMREALIARWRYLATTHPEFNAVHWKE